jgi:hypothetical protein
MKKCVETKLETSKDSTDTKTDCPFCKVPCENPQCIYKEKK